jgi:hypothetical protein
LKLSQLLLALTALNVPCVWASDQDPLAGIDKLGRYIGAARASQSMVYRMLDYCAQEAPDKREQILNARAQWDGRNLAMANSVKEVASNWFRSAGIPSESIPELLAVVDPSMADAAAAVHPEEKAVAALAALEPEERKKRCGFYTGFVISGGQDVRALFPKAQEFYQKYAPANP